MTDIVTSERPKNPGRQAWGRKLGKMSKELKFKKLVQNEEQEQPIPGEMDDKGPTTYLKFEYIVGLGALGLASVALYYQIKSYRAQGKAKPEPAAGRPQFDDF